MDEPIITPEMKKYFAAIGRKGGQKLLKARGREYYQRIAAMRKTHGRQKKTPTEGGGEK